MILRPDRQPSHPLGKPRASGDDPSHHKHCPHLREVNPARAGMIPFALTNNSYLNCKPRASGDDPRTKDIARLQFL